MAISPATGERAAIHIARLYANSEREVMQILAAELKKKAPDPEITAWAEAKLQNLNAIRREIEKKSIAGLDREVPKELQERLEDIYKRGQGSAVADLREVLDEDDIPVTEGFTRTNRRTVEALANETVDKLNASHLRILRTVEDQYRKVVAETVDKVTTGVATRLEASQAALNRFANRGISGFVDSAGRNWDITSYSEMAIRSASGRAAIQGQKDRMQENDRDLVVVSDHDEECPLCRPWEGRVLSISGEDPNYPPLFEAEEEGLFHPNCRHSLGAYIHGLTVTPDPEPDPSGYEDRQHQRYLERGVRKWKRREAAAMTDDAQGQARGKASEWQDRLKGFTEQEGRRRKYEREQITRAR